MITYSVYSYYDAEGGLLYVGFTGQGHRRQHQHATPGSQQPWWPLVATSEIEHFASEWDARTREKQLIQERRPAWNTTYNDASVRGQINYRIPRAVDQCGLEHKGVMGRPSPIAIWTELGYELWLYWELGMTADYLDQTTKEN